MNILGFSINTGLRGMLELFLADSPISKLFSSSNRSLLLTRSVGRKLIELYGGYEAHNIDYPSGSLGFGLVHYSLILNIRPKRILCVGSNRGFIPAVCSLACKENGHGHVDFVDAGYGPEDDNHWGGSGLWKSIDPEKYFSFMDIYKNLNLYVMTTDDFRIKYDNIYDYIYLDGDHSYIGIKNDYRYFWPRLNKGGFMSFHDINLKHMPDVPPLGVWKFWRELRGEKICLPYSSGLGILRKT